MTIEYISGEVSKLPAHSGDGYSWGGDVIVTFGKRSINLGTSHKHHEMKQIEALAHQIAAAGEMLALLERLANDYPPSSVGREWIDAAISKATGAA